MRKAICGMPVLVLLLAAAAAGEPFHDEWNWENQKLHGKVKSVTTDERGGKRYVEYDKDGKKILVMLYDDLGKVTHETHLKYNGDGDLNQVTFLRKGVEKPLYVERADYRSKGIIQTVTRTIGDKEMKSEPFVYGENKLVKKISIKTGDRMMTWGYTFNKEECLAGFELRQGTQVLLRAEYEKFEKGNATIMKSYRDGKLASEAEVSYKYDTQGNWTERTAKPILYIDGKKTEKKPHVTTRKMEYYE